MISSGTAGHAMIGNGAIPFAGGSIDRRARDAMAVLAHTYMQFNRADEAASLLGAIALIDDDPLWAQTARCLALLLAGHDANAADEAGRLLDQPVDDTRRGHLLRILARAAWNLGRESDARAYLAALRKLSAVTVLQPAGSRRP